MENIIEVQNLSKTYKTGFHALENVNLSVKKGEIFALLGPNGAGKTTLINIICGIVNPGTGKVLVAGFDNVKDYKRARNHIGLVPQELTTDMFEPVMRTVKFSRNLFGKASNDKHIEKVLKDLTLWEKRNDRIMTLSGGMKRRLMIAKALSHEPDILFLDEPTAGVDVQLRREMWEMVRKLRDGGVTVILTTHYIEEAQEMADRIGIINKGKLVLVEEKSQLLKNLGKRQLVVTLKNELDNDLKDLPVEVSPDRLSLTFTFDSTAADSGISQLMRKLDEKGIDYKDLHTHESSLEDIFVSLVGKK
ncbi:MAG: ABC transporter ATP-binding protein [Bacteriovoracaceae bacterium]